MRRPKHRMKAFVCLAAMTCAAGARTADAQHEGYVMLFNGKDLTGWQTQGDWFVDEQGVLALDPRPGRKGPLRYRLYLWTIDEYADFVLDFEFKLAKGGDSSVFVRSKSLFSYTEIELNDSHGKTGPLTEDDCGAVVKVMPPEKNMAKPAGQWNRMIITFQGTWLQVELNGQRVIKTDLAKSSSKRIPSSGRIGFQDWGHPVWFRNIRIKKLE